MTGMIEETVEMGLETMGENGEMALRCHLIRWNHRCRRIRRECRILRGDLK
jgi:hypothetical protein